MSTSEGRQSLDEIAGHWALHDGTLRAFAVQAVEGAGVVIDITCVPRPESPVAELRLRLSGVTRFDLAWDEGSAFYFVPGYTAFILESASVYLSLDPYDDRAEAPDSRDAGVIEARRIHAEFVMKRA
ncbi:hypothetical protein HPP05_15330 [Corallococcus exiguus]|nr:hypothetical protein [Corallococcus exiguus]RKH96279.1 hypothetical protein D7Y04_30655 [Corallococcus sp. AB038B]